MSYSVSARGRDKAEILQDIRAKLDQVVLMQSIHAADIEQAKAAAEAFLGVHPGCQSDGDKDLVISVSGSVGWRGTFPDSTITSVNVNVAISHAYD